MKKDTIITNINDTIYITKQKIDTIYNITYDKISLAQKDDIIQAYQKTIDTQASTYNLIITVFLGLIALFAGATWWYNRKIAKSEIIDEIHKTFKTEKKEFLAGLKHEFQNELHIQKAESARLFALVNISTLKTSENDQEKHMCHANLIYWWHEVFINNFIGGNDIGTRLGIDNIISSLNDIINENLEKEFFNSYQSIYNIQLIYNNLKYINDSLTNERNKIHQLLDKITSKNGKSFSPQESNQD